MNYFAIPLLSREIPAPSLSPIRDAERIFNIICEEEKRSRHDILSPSRDRELCFIRHLTVYFCRNQAAISWKKIARMVGRNDHTSAMHSYKAIEDLLFSDAATRDKVAFYTLKLME